MCISRAGDAITDRVLGGGGGGQSDIRGPSLTDDFQLLLMDEIRLDAERVRQFIILKQGGCLYPII